MHHIIFEENTAYRVAILSKATAFRKPDMLRYYVQPMERLGLKSRDMIGFTLKFNDAGKAPVKVINEYLANLLPALNGLGVEYLYVNDGSYFKALTKEKKAEANYGNVLPCAIKGFEHIKVVLGLNYQALIYDPTKVQQMDMGMQAMANHINGTYITLGSDIIHFAEYPDGEQAIKEWLHKLHSYPRLTADIEGFSLAFANCGVASISFAWNQNEGIAFKCDYEALGAVNELGHHGRFKRNDRIRALLREFFETYQGTVTWHYANFDCKVLAYTLWMDHPLDIEGMLRGIEAMTRGMHCTKVITYLAVNSCAGNTLGLKHNAQEFAGNWAQDDIKDIRFIPEKKLLQYNLVDSLSTAFLRDKNYPIMVRDQQEDLYLSLFRPSMKQILQTELVGMPMDDAEIQKAKAELETLQAKFLKDIMDEPIIAQFNVIHQTNKMDAANAKLKTKVHPLSHFAKETFNPGSPKQLQILLYDLMQLPIIKYTKTKQPATGGKVIKELLDHVNAQQYMACLHGIRNYAGVSKILAAFMPAFEGGMLKADGMRYLHGSLNLGGTVSGRLSSSDPNMQNLNLWVPL